MMLYDILTKNACKNSITLVLQVSMDFKGIPTAIYNIMLKPMATTNTFFMISRVILSIDDRHISPCNSLRVHLVVTITAWVNRAIYSCLVIHVGKARTVWSSSHSGKILPPVIYVASRCGSWIVGMSYTQYIAYFKSIHLLWYHSCNK